MKKASTSSSSSTTKRSGTTTTVKGAHPSTTAGSGSVTTTAGGGGGTGGGGGGGATGTTTPPTTTPGATTTPSGMAEITSYLVSSPPTCQTNSGSSTITVTWSSKHATEAWLLPGSTAGALVHADAKTTTPNFGPLPPNGSKTLPFDCGNDFNYALLEVYGGTTHSGTILQLPNNFSSNQVN